jgi:error-prone DNA polymerase
MKMQLVRGLTRMNADPDNPRESAFIRVPFSADPDNPRESAFIRVPFSLQRAVAKKHLTLLATNQQGYANLCRLITAARLDAGGVRRVVDQVDADKPSADWPGKIAAQLTWAQLAQHSAGLICLTGFRSGPLAAPLLCGDLDAAGQVVRQLVEIFGADHLFFELQHHGLPQDDLLIRRFCELARRCRLPVVATNDVHYAERAGSRLRDTLIAIDHNITLDGAQRAGLLPGHSNAYLAAAEEMARRFRERPDALANTLLIAERCQVSLDFSQQRMPAFGIALDQTPRLGSGTAAREHPSEFALLYQLCHDNLARRYPNLTPLTLTQLTHELSIIEAAGLAGYFLIVWDIVRFARSQGIRCQGRGSAANSIVAYLLGITSVDPLRHNLLFERFLSADKYTMPDIDIDFAADRREEVIRYVHQRYGRSHTAMVCNVVTYRARSALRDLGKALDFPLEVIERLAGQLESDSPSAAAKLIEEQVASEGPLAHPASVHPLRLLADLLRQIDGCPRHLSIHSGGMLISGPPLDEVVPLEPATMPGRVICQWDKDSVEDAGLIKIDLLALRTLGVISEALAHVTSTGRSVPDLEALSLDDPAIFAMLQRADTIGAFQVESRAQQQMLPRLRPERFEDMVIEVAIVRPGPIQGGAVHPYLRRRAGLEPVRHLHPSLEPVLQETLGVLLFQEQAIRVAVAAAGFLAGEADMLRRALSRARSDEAMQAMRQRFLQGAQQQGIDAETASAIFAQLAGFAGYGFCKSHAASFALIAYQTLWLKRYHPAAFYCALLNQQPMGFYPIEVLVGDARRHGVDLLPPDVNRSGWRYTIEKGTENLRAGGQLGEFRPQPDCLRTGLSAVNGLGEASWQRIESARQEAPFADLPDFCLRTRLNRDVIAALIRAGACDVFGERRQLLWRLGEIDYRPADLNLATPSTPVELADLTPLEQEAWEHELLGLAVEGQVMRHYRAELRGRGVLSTWQVKESEAGRRVAVAGLMVVRQRPATAKGIVFISLEDESGLLDLVVKPETYDRLRDVLRRASLVTVSGVVQRSGRAVSVLVEQATAIGG